MAFVPFRLGLAKNMVSSVLLKGVIQFFPAVVKVIFTTYVFQATVLKFGDLLAGWKLATNAKFEHSISNIMPARPKKYRNMGNEYHYN